MGGERVKARNVSNVKEITHNHITYSFTNLEGVL